MFEFLLEGAFAPFTMALALLFGLLLLELAALMLGGSLMSSDGDADFDVGGAPDLDALDIDLDVDVDADAFELAEFDPEVELEGAGPAGLSDWLGFGKMPTLIWIATLLMGFGLSGMALQMGLQELIGAALPGWLAALPAAVFGVWFARGFGAAFARLLPRTETEAMSERMLSRRRGVVTQGTAARGRPAEVRVTDRFGNFHYLRAEPMRDQDTLPQGSDVLVLRDRRSGSFVLIGMSE